MPNLRSCIQPCQIVFLCSCEEHVTHILSSVIPKKNKKGYIKRYALASKPGRRHAVSSFKVVRSSLWICESTRLTLVYTHPNPPKKAKTIAQLLPTHQPNPVNNWTWSQVIWSHAWSNVFDTPTIGPMGWVSALASKKVCTKVSEHSPGLHTVVSFSSSSSLVAKTPQGDEGQRNHWSPTCWGVYSGPSTSQALLLSYHQKTTKYQLEITPLSHPCKSLPYPKPVKPVHLSLAVFGRSSASTSSSASRFWLCNQRCYIYFSSTSPWLQKLSSQRRGVSAKWCNIIVTFV